MTARRIGLWCGLASLAIASARWANAQNQKYVEPQPVFMSEGRNPLTFNVSCATATWTIIVSSDTIARSTFMQSSSSNTNTICLLPSATGTAPSVSVSSQCVSATQGPELTPSSALTDYSHAAWYCASSSGTVANTIRGYRTRDKGDYGYIGAPGLQ